MMIVIALIGLLATTQASNTAGMILQIGGKATIERGGAQVTARLAELLLTGDRIRVEGGNLTLMFCPSSEKLILVSGTTIEIQANAVRVVSGGQPARSPAQCALPKVVLGQENMERIGGIRGRGNPPIALYTGGLVSTARPVFEWAGLEGNPTYRFALKNVDGDTIWQTQTSATKAAYPDTMSPLAAGAYTWELRAEAAGKTVGEQTANLEVKPGRGETRPVDQAAMLMEATRLENEGYYGEAAGYFRELLKANPSDERISRHLSWLYWNAGLIAAFDLQMKNQKD